MQRKVSILHESLEDGTLPFHSIIALGCAIDVHKSLYGSMKLISQHTSFLAQRLYSGISSIGHFNGRRLCKIYTDLSEANPYADPTTQGATLAFNVVRADGSYIRYSEIEKLANEKGIFLRSGGLCNPGGIASYLELKPWQLRRAFAAGYKCGEPGPWEVINGKPIGVVRASLGAMSTITDVDTFLLFMLDTFIKPEAQDITLKGPTLASFNFGKEDRTRKDSGFAVGNEENVSPQIDYHPEQFASLPTAVKPGLRQRRSFYSRRNKSPLEQIPQMPQISRVSEKWLDQHKTARSFGDLRNASHATTREHHWTATDENHDVGQRSNFSLRFWKDRKATVLHYR